MRKIFLFGIINKVKKKHSDHAQNALLCLEENNNKVIFQFQNIPESPPFPKRGFDKQRPNPH